MKLDALTVLLDENFKIKKNFYFISGNEPTLIQKISAVIIEKYKKQEKINVNSIETIGEFVNEAALFEDRKINLIKNCKGVDEGVLNTFKKTSDIFIFTQENSQKIKKVKNIFLKNKDAYLIECYELEKTSKIKIINYFIKLSDIVIDKDIYWYLVEKLDNKYSFLENNLNKILKLDKKDMNIFNIKKLLTIDSLGKDKIFFNLLKKNQEIVEIYREKINSSSDVNELYYYCKFFCQLIIDCNNENEYNKKIPLYLFREKVFLLDIFKRFNSEKKKLLLGLLSSTEKILRKNSDLSLATGLRFLLGIKKITIS